MRTADDESLPFLSLNPAIVNGLTLGHKGLFHDFSYFWLLGNLIHDRAHTPSADKMFAKIKLLTRQLPEIESLYTLSCYVMAFEYRKPELCEQIASDGMKALPKNWLIPAIVGYMFAFKLNDPFKGAYYYKKTRGLPRSPEYLSKLADRLLRGEVKKQDSNDAMDSIFNNTEDSEYKDVLHQFLDEKREQK